jgi:hypothetical protein
MIPIDSGWVWTWNQIHWLAYQIIFPSIYGSSKTESICALGINLLGTASEIRDGLELDLGLHLGDSNRKSFGPPSWWGHPCWSPRPLSPRMVICMEVMSSSPVAPYGGLVDPLCGLTSLYFLPYFPYDQIECMYIWNQVIFYIKYVHAFLGSYHLWDIVDISDHTNSCHNDHQQAPPHVCSSLLVLEWRLETK